MNGREANNIANAKTRKLTATETHALERVDTITRNARGIWFGLLGALVFAGVTLLGVEDIDFFGVDRNTKLPLIGVSVPVTYFFAAGAALVTAFYVYFHLYLVQLWEALGEAPARPNGRALSKTVHPWLVSDAVVRWRGWLRDEDCADPRPLAWVGGIVSFVFVWLFGLVILGYFWWRSMPLHNQCMTLGLAVLLSFAFGVALRSFTAAYRSIRKPDQQNSGWRRWLGYFWNGLRTVGFILLVCIAMIISWLRTENGLDDYMVARSDQQVTGEEDGRAKKKRHAAIRKKYDFLVRANLTEKHITTLPKDWQPRDHAEKWFREDWCKREGIDIRIKAEAGTPESFPCKNLNTEDNKTFTEEWQTHRATYLDNLSRPNLADRDLRRANMFKAFLPRLDLRRARLEGANLSGARLEGANLSGARLEGASLSGAWLDRANLSGAWLDRANLTQAQLGGANLIGAWLEGANLIGARLEGANLNQAWLEGANLTLASLEGANLSRASLEGANLVLARLEEVNLSGAWLKGALLSGTAEDLMVLKSTQFTGTSFRRTSVTYVDFTGSLGIFDIQFKQMFGDGSVILPTGQSRPCHWAKQVLGTDVRYTYFTPSPNDPFIGRWRGWVELNGGAWPTSVRFAKFKDVVAIKPVHWGTGEDCPPIPQY